MNNNDRNVIQALTSVITDIGQAIEKLDKKIENHLKLFNVTEVSVPSNPIFDTVTKESHDFNRYGLPQLEDEPVEKEWKPIHEMIKNNKFVDDGSAFQGEVDKTPRVSPVERKREQWESHLTERACSRCNKTEKVNKVHATGSIHVCQRCARR